MPGGNSMFGIKNVLARVRRTEQRAGSSFIPSSSPVSAHSQHWSNLILDLRDQHLGQHDACNLEDSSSCFKLHSRLSVTVHSVLSISRFLWKVSKCPFDTEHWDCCTPSYAPTLPRISKRADHKVFLARKTHSATNAALN